MTTTPATQYANYPNENIRKDIVDKIQERLNYMTSNHCKVCVVLLVVRYPAGCGSINPNDEFSDFLSTLSKYIRRQHCEFQRVAVVEQNISPLPHMHVCWFLDGSRFNSAYSLGRKADELWSGRFNPSVDSGLVDFRNQRIGSHGIDNGMIIERDGRLFSYLYGQIMDSAIYLAKEYSKGGQPKHRRDVTCSQMPRE